MAAGPGIRTVIVALGEWRGIDMRHIFAIAVFALGTLLAIANTRADVAWSVSDTSPITATFDGSTSWFVQSMLAGGRRLDFVDGNHGWMVGLGGVIAHTADGGATWTPQTSGTAAALLGVSFVDA